MYYSDLSKSLDSILESVEDSQNSHDIGHFHETTTVKHFNKITGATQPRGLNDAHDNFSSKIHSNIIKSNIKNRGEETAKHIHDHQRSLGISPSHAEHVGEKGNLTDMLVHGVDVNGSHVTTRYSLKVGEDKKTNLPAATRNVSNRIFGTNTPTKESRTTHINHVHDALSKMDEHGMKSVLSRITKNTEDSDNEKSADYEVKNRGNMRTRTKEKGRITTEEVDRRFHPDRVHSVEYKGRAGENTLHLHVHTVNPDMTTSQHRISIFGHKDGRTQFVSSEV